MSTFAERLKAQMKEHNETAVSLAEKAKLDRSVVQRLASGDRRPHEDHIKALAKALDVAPAVLMDDSAPANQTPAAEAIARFIEGHPDDLTARERRALEEMRTRLDKSARVSEADVLALLRVIREVYPVGGG